jgi:chorismate dehydratase
MSKNLPIKISAVSYANTFPFLYGIDRRLDLSSISLSKDVPAVCADKLQNEKVDIGLIPVAKLGDIPNANIISDYCIGAVGEVKTVLLMSKVPLENIEQVFLDSESRTSINLVKILAKHHWKKNWQWIAAPKDFPKPEIHQSIVLIGDKTYNFRADYPYIYDLAQLWQEFTGKPFVFAVWVANRVLPNTFVKEFNEALSFGLQNISTAIDVYAEVEQKEELENYLNHYISYDFDSEKREGMELFLDFLKEMN